jgi:hypothetical protein
MGMFDYVKSEVPLPDGYTGELQSKSFNFVLTTILIRADGRLLIKDQKYESVPLSERPFPHHPRTRLVGSLPVTDEGWRDLDFHGDFRFHGYDSSAKAQHDYLARFTHGQLEYIKTLPEPPTKERESEGLARAIEFQRYLLLRAGGALTSEEVALRLGLHSAQPVQDAVISHQLLGLDFKGEQVFPAFQFVGDQIAQGMAAVLLAAPNTTGWALLQYIVEGDEGLGSELPMDLVRGGPDDVARAARFARTLEE